MTFNDFITECGMYDHSQEHYELMKECSELTLMEQYVENHKFMLENAAFINSGEVAFTEGYFMEADQSVANDVAGKIKKKQISIFRRIFNNFRRLVRNFIKFFEKFLSNDEKTEAMAEKIWKFYFKNKNLSNENMQTDFTKFNEIYLDLSKKPYAKCLGIGENNRFLQKDAKYGYGIALLDVIVNNKDIVFDPASNKASEFVPIPLDTMNFIFKNVNKKDIAKMNFQNVFGVLDGAVKSVQSNGFVIDKKYNKITKEINKLKVQLNDVETLLSGLDNVNPPLFDDKNPDEVRVWNDAKQEYEIKPTKYLKVKNGNTYKDLEIIYTNMAKYMATTITFYSAYKNMRHDAIVTVGSYVATKYKDSYGA